VPYPPTPAQTIRARSVRRSQMTLEALRPSFSAKSVGRERYQTSGLGHQTADRSAMAILGLLAPLTCFGLGAPWTRRSSWRLWGGIKRKLRGWMGTSSGRNHRGAGRGGHPGRLA
jgi:hypothetical protein